MKKEIIFYDKSSDYYIGEIGNTSLVSVIQDFNVGNTLEIRTSAVIEMNRSSGEFETYTAIYCPLRLGRNYG